MVTFDDKNWELSITRNMSFFHAVLDNLSAGDPTYFKKFDIPARQSLTVIHDARHAYYFNNHDSLKIFNAEIEKKCTTPGWIHTLEHTYYQAGNNLINASTKLETDFTQSTFEAFVDAYAHLTPGLFLTSAIGRHMLTVLQKELCQLYPQLPLHDIDAIIGTITYPKGHTPLAESQIDLLTIGALLQQSNMSVDDLESNTSTHNTFSEFYKKHSFIPVNFNEEPWSESDVRTQLKELMKHDCIQEKQVIEQQHNTRVAEMHQKLKEINNERITLIAQSLQVGTLLNEYRKNVFSRASLAYRPLFKDIAQTYNLDSWKTVWFLTHNEIVDLYYNKDTTVLEHISKRIWTGVTTDTQTQYRILTHNEHTLFVDEIQKPAENNSANDQKEITGMVANKGYVKAPAKIILSSEDFDKFEDGDIIVTSMTSVDFVPLMKRASAFVTNEGGITSHAAIVSRELNKPCIIGTKHATKLITSGDIIEVDTENGMVRILS